ncbi:O-acetyl-ADP-ribose deacetylase [Desulfatirhabdium butyrativorans]|uniref:O-acetyl-ADP-ribose deacetylase n=1 Tax=Desulfatirhabdium butyrativorans TaxID=340467 RepID=UPI000421A102|nr:O-acetyl-ADP-ribose deacetylase [Desulfatirhabdium butyrativorans]
MIDPFQRIEIVQGDITKLAVDAIVNAANSRLMGGGGVDGAIHRAAGPELLQECRTLGGCPTGEARVTRGYRLPARWVIHTVGPVYHANPADPVLLAACYRNSLALAQQIGAASVAFPAISCGAYGYPFEEACAIALETTVDFLRPTEGIERVIFVLFSSDQAQIYQNKLAEMNASSGS